MPTVVEVFTTPGEFSWTCPEGVTSLDYVICFGGGQGGSAESVTGSDNTGGRGGDCAYSQNVAVTPSSEYGYVVGEGGDGGEDAAGNDGQGTSWDSNNSNLPLAAGGTTAGGTSFGDVTFAGGAGALGVGDSGGGSGGGAGTGAVGAGAVGAAAGGGGAANPTIASILAAAGHTGLGAGGDGATGGANGAPGANGTVRGGGGSGAGSGSGRTGGSGAGGAVFLVYQTAGGGGPANSAIHFSINASISGCIRFSGCDDNEDE
jgi:hypothetical protein